MNVIVSNRYAAMLSNLNIDLIKSINGEFEVDNLIAQFDNFFFIKMILDITAIKGYKDINQIQRLSFGMDMSKVILLLDDSPEVKDPTYISGLVSMGIYNFTRNIDAIPYLIENPNSYKDVAQFHLIGSNNNGNMPPSSMPNQMPNQMPNNNYGGFNNGNRNSSFFNDGMFAGNGANQPTMRGTRVIGFKSLTDHAGATSLIYMLKKQLSDNYSVMGLELDKNDFMFFGDQDLRSISSKELDSIINNPVNNYDVILIDVNDSPEESKCTEMIYLIEPSTIMINKMVRRNRNILEDIRGKKVVLIKSLLDYDDVRQFESEARCSVFQNIPPLDDKKDRHRVLDEFLNKLGFDKNRPQGDNNRSARLFGIVKE